LKKKTEKIVSASGDPPPNPASFRRVRAPPPDPRVVTTAYYCHFVEFISSAKMRFTSITLKK